MQIYRLLYVLWYDLGPNEGIIRVLDSTFDIKDSRSNQLTYYMMLIALLS